MDKNERQHYEDIQRLHARFNEHTWSRRQTIYDSKMIAWLDKELQIIENEAYHLFHDENGNLLTDLCTECNAKTREATAREIFDEFEEYEEQWEFDGKIITGVAPSIWDSIKSRFIKEG